jgi:hypothetical protein
VVEIHDVVGIALPAVGAWLVLGEVNKGAERVLLAPLGVDDLGAVFEVEPSTGFLDTRVAAAVGYTFKL